MYLRAIYVMQVIGKRRTWDRMVFWDFTCSAIFRRPFGHWSFLFHLMDYDKDFGVCPVRQPYADVYTVMKNQSHASDLSDSAKSRHGRRSQDDLCQCPKLETRTLLFPCIRYISNAHMSVRPNVHNTRKGAHSLLSQRRLCNGFFHALSLNSPFHHFQLISFPMLVCAMHATAASPAPSPTAPAYSTWASMRVLPRSPPSAPSSRAGVARGGSSCRIGGRRLLH